MTTDATGWLLGSDDPSVRFMALTDLLGRNADDADVVRAREQIARSPRATALLRGQQSDGGFGVPSYEYWRGKHWRLLNLALIRCPPGDERVAAAFEDEMRSVVEPFARGAVTIDRAHPPARVRRRQHPGRGVHARIRERRTRFGRLRDA